MPIRYSLLCCLLIFCCSKPMRVELTSQEKQATKDAIERFRQGGSNLDKPHDIEFIFANGTKVPYNTLRNQLQAAGLKPDRIAAKGDDVHIHFTMKLDYERIIDIESRLTYIAHANGVEYDG